MLIITMRHFLKEFINIFTTHGIHNAATAFNANQRKCGIKNDPRQAHSANGGPKEWSILIGAKFLHSAISKK